MKDFNIAKYLREHQQGSFGILNHYIDLQPVNEDKDLGQQDAMPEPYEGPEDPIDGLGGELDRDMDVSMNEEENSEKENHDEMSKEYVSWLEKNNLPERSADELLYKSGIELTDDQKKYLEMFIDRWEAAEDDSVNEVSAFEEKYQYYEGEVNDLVYDMMDTTGADKDQVADFFQYISTKIRNQGIF